MRRHDDWISDLYFKQILNMETVRAKFKVIGFSKESGNNGFQVELWAVHNGSEENKQFFKHTPSGQIHMSVLQEDTAKFFQSGHEYYVDFIKAEKK